MKNALEKFGKEICQFETIKDIKEEYLKDFTDNTFVALSVGGKGDRLGSVTKNEINKNAIVVSDNGESIVERTVKMYKDAGIANFVALVFSQSDSIIDRLGDGKKLGVNISYSFDPGKPVGRGGAILNALMNKIIPNDKNLIVHNPCDQILDYPKFVYDIIRAHINGENKGNIATVVVTKATPYTFTGMKIHDSAVKEIEMYPMIPIPAHIGVTVFSNLVYSYFKELFNLNEKVDFEARLFPHLSKLNKLYSFGIDQKHWIAVKDPKALKELRERLGYNIL